MTVLQQYKWFYSAEYIVRGFSTVQYIIFVQLMKIYSWKKQEWNLHSLWRALLFQEFCGQLRFNSEPKCSESFQSQTAINWQKHWTAKKGKQHRIQDSAGNERNASASVMHEKVFEAKWLITRYNIQPTWRQWVECWTEPSLVNALSKWDVHTCNRAAGLLHFKETSNQKFIHLTMLEIYF